MSATAKAHGMDGGLVEPDWAPLTLDEVRAAIKAKGLPNIAVPREVKFIHEIPKLGTGKVNYRELDEMI